MKTKEDKRRQDEDRMKRNKSKGENTHLESDLWPRMFMVQIRSFSSFKLVLLYEPS